MYFWKPEEFLKTWKKFEKTSGNPVKFNFLLKNIFYKNLEEI